MFVLDAYAARSCPVKTQNAFHPGVNLPQPADEALREVFRGGITFADDVLSRLIAESDLRVTDCRGLRDHPSAEQERACLDALAAGSDVVIGGLLPRDWTHHRSGRPDLLLRGPGGYRPAQVKFHRVVDVRRDDSVLQYSTLADPLSIGTLPGHRFRRSWRLNDVLQLAHYRRMLLSIGFGADDALAAIIGTDELNDFGPVLSWVSLDEAVSPPGPRSSAADQGRELISPLERYDDEFDFRVRVAEAASRQAPDDPPVLRPVVNRECGYCPWWDVCRPLLDDDDLSLRIERSPLDVHEIRMLRELGVATVAELAGADLESLLPRYLPLVTHRHGAEERLRLAQRRSVLLEQGVDFDRLTEGPIEVPSALVEIDIDVETSGDDRVYLWGFWVEDGRTGASYYQHFGEFRELDDESEWALAVRAMSWLRTLTEGTDAAIFHYSDYEVVRIDRLAEASGDPLLAWASQCAHESFVDLFTIIRTHFFGTHGLGLKVVASKAAGFEWRDESPGGLNSQGWFADAVRAESADDRAGARQRVLDYNEDDVRATWHVRRWLRETTGIPQLSLQPEPYTGNGVSPQRIQEMG